MTSFAEVCWLVVVALLWGGTNPLIKKGGAGIEDIKKNNAIIQFFAELRFLITNWHYMVPFLLNQTGSLLFYITLASADISLAVPLTNSLTFMFTIIVGRMMGEEVKSYETYVGMGLVIFGVALCVISKGAS